MYGSTPLFSLKKYTPTLPRKPQNVSQLLEEAQSAGSKSPHDEPGTSCQVYESMLTSTANILKLEMQRD